MERLTEYDEIFDNYFYGKRFDKATDKLGKLEDLEEKIGMPLDVFVDLSKCNSVVYSIENGYLQKLQAEVLTHINNLIPCGFVLGAYEDNYDSEAWEDLYFNDFNKTWFLTREEAEKKLEELKRSSKV
ncbi:MAG: hypothetical protein RR585_01800 [Coprobacillus sp.]